MTFNSDEWPKGNLQTLWIWNPGKLPSFCTGVLKMYNFWFHRPSWLIEPYFELSWISQKCELAGTYLSENSSPKGSFWRNKRIRIFLPVVGLICNSVLIEVYLIFIHSQWSSFYLCYFVAYVEIGLKLRVVVGCFGGMYNPCPSSRILFGDSSVVTTFTKRLID